jgi:hypothetical protein
MRDKLWDLAHGRRVRMRLGCFDKGFGMEWIDWSIGLDGLMRWE